MAKTAQAGRFDSTWRHRLTDYLYIAVMILVIAKLTQRFGQADVLGDSGLGASVKALLPLADVLYYVGMTVESYFPLILTVAVAVALAKRSSAGVAWAATAAWVGYTGASSALSHYGIATEYGSAQNVNLGVAAGFLLGAATAWVWNTFREVELAPWAQILNGTPLVVVIATSAGVLVGVVGGIAFHALWLVLVGYLGSLFAGLPPALAGFLFGFLKPLTTAVGLDSILVQYPFNGYGQCRVADNQLINGSYTCFLYGGEQTQGQAGLFLSGGYAPVGFGLTMMLVALWFVLPERNRSYWSLPYLLLALGVAVAGAEAPVLYVLLLGAPPLLLVHAVFSGISYALSAYLAITIGYTGGPGILDLVRWLGGGQGIWSLMILGLVYVFLYAFIGQILGRKRPSWFRLAGFGYNRLTTPVMGAVLTAVEEVPGQAPEEADPLDLSQPQESQPKPARRPLFGRKGQKPSAGKGKKAKGKGGKQAAQAEGGDLASQETPAKAAGAAAEASRGAAEATAAGLAGVSGAGGAGGAGLAPVTPLPVGPAAKATRSSLPPARPSLQPNQAPAASAASGLPGMPAGARPAAFAGGQTAAVAPAAPNLGTAKGANVPGLPPHGAMAGQMPPHVPAQMPPHLQRQMHPQMPAQIPGQMPPAAGALQGHLPGPMPGAPLQGQVPGQVAGQVPGKLTAQLPPQMPGLAPAGMPQMPGLAPGARPLPGQIPGQVPGQIPGQVPGQIPGQMAPRTRPVPPGGPAPQQ